MFTGIVDHQGIVSTIERNEKSLRLAISTQFTDIQEGESIAVNGVCLTAVQPQAKLFYSAISPETLQVTNLNKLSVGQPVNLERALRMNDRLGGHWVSGHVDQVCKIIAITPLGDYVEYSFAEIAPTGKQFFIKKGSVAVNGVSLTINELTPDGFKVMLIPHTLEITNLKTFSVGDYVNIEYDWLMKIIVSQLAERMSLLHITGEHS